MYRNSCFVLKKHAFIQDLTRNSQNVFVWKKKLVKQIWISITVENTASREVWDGEAPAAAALRGLDLPQAAGATFHLFRQVRMGLKEWNERMKFFTKSGFFLLLTFSNVFLHFLPAFRYICHFLGISVNFRQNLMNIWQKNGQIYQKNGMKWNWKKKRK